MRNQSASRHRRVTLAVTLMLAAAIAPRAASAEDIMQFLFGGGQPQPQKQQRQQRPSEASPMANFFADPFGLNTPAAPPPPRQASGGSSSGPAFCVRSCDGKYFPLMARAGATPAQMCQAFCPASATKVFFGSHIESASAGGERYADSDNAFAYRKALKPDCTCNGRTSAGLAPVDLTLDTSLRSGDVVATANGLVAYSGARLGAGQTPDFTPVASFPGLTSDIRARLGEMKVAPVSAEMIDNGNGSVEIGPELAPATAVAKPAARKGRRAEAR